jgi:hypothetical protein
MIKLNKSKDIEFKQEFFEFGIYRAIVKSNSKLFSVNRYNYYTHIDLTRAKELNLDIQLIQDGQANFLHYSRDKCLTGYEIFGEYVDLLFDLKQTTPEKMRILGNFFEEHNEPLHVYVRVSS